MRNLFLYLCLVGLLASCASTPVFDTSDVDRTLNPKVVIAEPELSLDKLVLWGGTILDTQNLKDFTQIEVLSYPLDSSDRPRLDQKPLGRFIIRNSGYLEPEHFSQGRRLSVLGKVGEKMSGKVGNSDYIYPLIHAQQLQLWSPRGQTRSNFQFGFGIHLSN